MRIALWAGALDLRRRGRASTTSSATAGCRGAFAEGPDVRRARLQPLVDANVTATVCTGAIRESHTGEVAFTVSRLQGAGMSRREALPAVAKALNRASIHTAQLTMAIPSALRDRMPRTTSSAAISTDASPCRRLARSAVRNRGIPTGAHGSLRPQRVSGRTRDKQTRPASVVQKEMQRSAPRPETLSEAPPACVRAPPLRAPNWPGLKPLQTLHTAEPESTG